MRVDRRRILALLLAGTAPPVWAQGFAGLGQSAAGFALPQPDKVLRFPRDHGAHTAFRIEWWYVTANLQGPDGAEMGVQWTLFRTALAPDDAPGWASPQIWFAHGAMTRRDSHVVAQRQARGGIGQAGVTPAPFAAWIDDWQMQSRAPTDADALSELNLNARGDDWQYHLSLRADEPLILHGDQGYSLKHDRGQASHYYSQPHYRAEGVLHWPDGPVPVTGQAWLDREWSSQPLDPDQTGWDWFSLHLDGGAKLMVFRLRDDGAGYRAGTWIDPAGQTETIPDGAITLSVIDETNVAGRTIPTRWRIEIPGRGLDLITTPVNPYAWMGTDIAYWEGPVQVTGTHAGRGYLEMTGYE